ncbi:MAG: PAS domain S-box protein, partial [Nitrospirae bacterium]|nr:PAS domain S-box protein [Nitrospirota bacterium]
MTTQSNHSLIPFKFFSQLCGLIAAGLGVVAIVGWLTGWRILSGIRTDYIPMAPNTALSFIVLGISLCALLTERKRGLTLSRIGATVIFVLSLIRSTEISVNINLDVDRWIFQVPSEKLGLIPVGRMALPTALNFLFASVALFLASSLKRRWSADALTRVLAGLTTFIGLAFCLGYIYGAPLLYGGTTIPMALNTALSFFVLGLGLVINNASHDIAERKRDAEALRKAHDELEVRVAERTAELAKANEALRAEIIERRHAEEALRESENKFRDLAEKSIVGVYLIQDGVFRYANSRLAEIFGYTIYELIDKRGPEDLVLPEDWPIVEENLRKRISGEIESINYDFRGITKDKEIIYVEVYGSKTVYRGRPAVIGTLLDITERNRAEEVRAFLANITEHATDAIEGIDLDTNIVSWNRGAEMLFGYSAQEIIGRPHSLIVPKEAQEACRERFKKATLEGSVRAETGRIKKDGRGFPVEMTLTALKDDRGEHTGFVCITRDITERKKLEEQFRQAQKMEAIGQLAGGIAHDFNNILNAIIGFGNLIEMNTREDDPNRAYLKEILDAGERGSHLTQSLLAFSRKQIRDLKPQNLNEIIKGVEKFLMRIIGEDIELKTELLDKDLTVLADRGQIEQIVMNLATNARDAMPVGGDLIIETGTIQIDEEYV